MNPKETRELIAEARRMAPFYDKSGTLEVARILERLADALAVLSAPQEAKSIAKVVPVSYEASASCSHGVCPTGCSHLMWACSACSCEGGWGASRERLEELAAEHVCQPAPQEGDARERLHAKCDCVPDLGPAHCHLCGNEKGTPVPWAECSAVRAAAPEPEWEYRYAEIHDDSEMYTYGPRDNPDCCFDTAEDARDERIEDTDVVVRRPKRPASEWEVCE